MPSLSVRGEPPLFVRALSGEFVRQAVDGLVVGQNGADVLFKERREPQTHAVNLNQNKQDMLLRQRVENKKAEQTTGLQGVSQGD